MKQVLLLLMILPLAALSQRIQSDQTDDLKKSRRIATSRVEFNGFSTSLGGMLKIKETDTLIYMNLFFKAGKPTVIDETTTAVLKLENGESIEVRNLGSYKELTATEPGFIHFSLNEWEKAKLMAIKVSSYSIQTAYARVDVILNEHQQNAFHKTIYLLQSQARSMASLDE